MMKSSNRLRPLLRPSRERSREGGFTLLELLVVLVILGLLIGLVAPAALRQLGNAKQKIAHQQIERIGSVLEMYKLDNGTFPSSDQGLAALSAKPTDAVNWNGPYIKGEAPSNDPWGRPFIYRSPSSRQGYDYDLCTLGSQGQAGGSGEGATVCNQ
jgi:general secretion pathway protein G